MPRVIHSDGGESDDSDLSDLSDNEQDMEIDNSDDEEDIPLAYLKRQHLSTAVVQSEKIAVELVKTITEVMMDKTIEMGAVVDVGATGVEDQEKETEEETSVPGEKQNVAEEPQPTTEPMTKLATQPPKAKTPPDSFSPPFASSPRLTEDVPRSEQIRLRRDAESSAAPSESSRRGSIGRERALGLSIASSVMRGAARREGGVSAAARVVGSYPTSPTDASAPRPLPNNDVPPSTTTSHTASPILPDLPEGISEATRRKINERHQLRAARNNAAAAAVPPPLPPRSQLRTPTASMTPPTSAHPMAANSMNGHPMPLNSMTANTFSSGPFRPPALAVGTMQQQQQQQQQHTGMSIVGQGQRMSWPGPQGPQSQQQQQGLQAQQQQHRFNVPVPPVAQPVPHQMQQQPQIQQQAVAQQRQIGPAPEGVPPAQPLTIELDDDTREMLRIWERTQQRTRQAQACTAGLNVQIQHLDQRASELARSLEMVEGHRNVAVAAWCAERDRLRRHADEWQRALHVEQARAQRLELVTRQNQQGWDEAVRQEHQVILAVVAGAVAQVQSRKESQQRHTRLHRRIDAVESNMETLKAELETCRAERDALREQIGTNTARHETDVAFIRFQAESEMTSLTETHEQQLARLEGQLKSAHERLTATRNLLESQDQAVGALRLQKTGLEDQLKQIQATAEAETGKEVLRLRVGMNVEMDAARARAREREAELMSRLETAAKDAETSKAALSVTQGDVDKMRQEAIRRGEQLAESRKECDELRQKLQEKSIAPPPASSRATSRPRSRSRPRTSISSGSQVEDLAPMATTEDDDDDDIIILDEDPGITSSRRAPQPPPKSQPKPSTPSQRSKRSRPADEDMEMLKKVAKEIVARSFTEDYMCKFCLSAQRNRQKGSFTEAVEARKKEADRVQHLYEQHATEVRGYHKTDTAKRQRQNGRGGSSAGR